MQRIWTDLYQSWRHPTTRLNVSQDELDAHLAALDTFVQDSPRQEANNWLIDNLDTIDRKAQGLLLLGAVVLTIATLLYPRIGDDLGVVGLIAIVATMGVLIVACIQLAILNVVYWTSTEEFHDPPNMLKHLLEIREMRTRIIWRCCMLDAVCLLSILTLVVLDAVLA